MGATHRFGSLIESVRGAGLLSTYGFISQLVVRLADFVAVDASPYLGLTMFPQVGMLFEAFAERSVCYHNVPLVHHRTPSGAEPAEGRAPVL